MGGTLPPSLSSHRHREFTKCSARFRNHGWGKDAFPRVPTELVMNIRAKIYGGMTKPTAKMAAVFRSCAVESPLGKKIGAK